MNHTVCIDVRYHGIQRVNDKSYEKYDDVVNQRHEIKTNPNSQFYVVERRAVFYGFLILNIAAARTYVQLGCVLPISSFLLYH